MKEIFVRGSSCTYYMHFRLQMNVLLCDQTTRTTSAVSGHAVTYVYYMYRNGGSPPHYR